MFIKSTSLIIPTKDRPENLRRFISSFNEYIKFFNEILLIDSSNENNYLNNLKHFSIYKNFKVIKSNPSSSLQRNVGIEIANKKNDYFMFCDDDIILEKNSLYIMHQFIKTNKSFIGYGFNLIEKKENKLIDKIKKKKILVNTGFYHFNPGVVCDNGWHTKIVNCEQNFETKWLSTQACIYKSDYIKKSRFNTKLGKYSYLEDLFFSYEMSKKGKLIVCSKSIYYSKNFIERKSFDFGYQEAVNRYLFVQQNHLNKFKFYISIFLKSLFTLFKVLRGKLIFFPKFFGNIIGIISCITKRK